MNLIGSHIKVILFDHDDTLVGTIEPKWAAHKHIAKTLYNKELTDDEIRMHWGKPLRTFLGLIYGDNDTDRALAREAATHNDFPKILLEDTLPVLEYLHNSGKRLGVITATSRQSFEHDISTLGIDISLFGYVQTQDDTKYHKPDPKVFERTLKWLDKNHIGKKEVLYIGDGLHDMHAALGASFEFIGTGTGLVTTEEFHNNGVQAVTRLSELVK